ncbi:sensor histidine kinase [Clostridium tunisiense]|uniref:sensor histidine kinase n=1 Tax=Clostridium tunisiense TaxID=219748 RepID=UPI0002E6B4F1|nr:PAS domain-containing sensor histidine kinase [Clostridium tunisiense]
MNSENFYRDVVRKSSFAYFYGKVIREDNRENIIDFIILDANEAFKNTMKLKEEVIGRTIREVFSTFIGNSFSWIEFFSEVQAADRGKTVEVFLDKLNSWFQIHITHYENDKFIVQLVEVHREEPFIKALVNNLPFSAWAKDKNGRYILVNNHYEKDSEFSLNKVRGRTDFELWDRERAVQFYREDNEVVKSQGDQCVYEYYFKEMWYKTYKTAVYDENKNFMGTIGFSMNIDEGKKFKTEINNKDKFFKTLINSIPDFVFYKDINGVYSGLNEAILREFFGKQEKELVGKTDRDLIEDSKQVEEILSQDREVIKAGKSKVYEETLTLIDGSVRQYETIKSPFYDENNNIVGILGISRDITQRNLFEKKLMDSEEKFRQLAENIDGVFYIREGEKITYVSPGYEKIFGRSCKDLYKDSWDYYSVIHPEDRHIINEAKGEKEIDKTYRIISADGKIKWIWTRTFWVESTGIEDKPRVLGISQDITTIKEAEREIERLRTEFFANLSHEFRTPLNLIFSSLQMLEFNLSNEKNENLRSFKNYIKIIKQNSFRLLRLISNLIDTTKMDAGHVDYCPENYDIVNYVEGICGSVAGFAQEKGIEVIFDTDCEEKVIAFDLDKMERIILNLLSNAIKFNTPDGKIEVQVETSRDKVQISVKDTGIGIPQDKLQDVFERFKQVNNRLTKISEGSGIGLSLVKSFVELHGGTIEVKSELEKGTEFIIILPDNVVPEDEDVACNSQLVCNSRVERIRIEFSDIYGIDIRC